MMTEEEKAEIDAFDEMMLYFLIDALGGVIWRINHDIYSHGRYEMTPEIEADMKAMSEKQVYCVSLLTKFGIDPESAKDRPNGDYWKWFDHWNNWKKGMDDDTWRIVDRKLSKKEDVSEYLPKHKWNEVIVT